MKKCKKFSVLIIFFGLVFAACDGGTSGNGTSRPNSTETWGVIKSAADIAGVWEGSSQIELLGDGEILPSTGAIGFEVTLMNERLESKVDMVMKNLLWIIS